METIWMFYAVLLIILIFPQYAADQCCQTSSSNSTDCGDITYGIEECGTVCNRTTGQHGKCAKVTCNENATIYLICIETGSTGFWSPISPVFGDVTKQPQTTTPSPAESSTTSTITTVITTSTGAAANTSTDATTNTTTTTTTSSAAANTSTDDSTSTAATTNTTTTTTNTTTIATTKTATTTTTAAATFSATSSTPSTTQVATGINKGISSNDENIAVFVAVPVCIVVVIIIVIIFIIMRRRKTRSKGAAVIKQQLHGAISNNLYQNPTSNGNIIPMNNLAPATIDNGYVYIFDDKPTPIDTSDSSYNTISLPNESGNTYGHLKPVTQPFVDNTYSHMNKTQMQFLTYWHCI